MCRTKSDQCCRVLITLYTHHCSISHEALWQYEKLGKAFADFIDWICAELLQLVMWSDKTLLDLALKALALFTPHWPLTEEVVPLRVQVGLVGQTPTHHVETVVLAGLQRHLAGAVGTVQHLHGGAHTAGRRADLQTGDKNTLLSDTCSSWKKNKTTASLHTEV